MTLENLKEFRKEKDKISKKSVSPLTAFEKVVIDDFISKHKTILRLNDINMAIDFKLKKDYIHNRYIHSMQVANGIEIMTCLISEKLGFNLDPRGIFKYAGVFHDIGHTSFGHQGERELNARLKTKGIFFDGNANNYIALKKSLILDIFTEEDKHYIMASLAKHFNDLYPEQEEEKKIIFEQIIKDEMFLKDNGINTMLHQTLACMIMDKADENAYLITDLMDAMNVVSVKEMEEGIKKYASKEVQDKLIPALKESKSRFREALNSYTIVFASNFKLEDGKIIHEDEEIENIRKTFRKININLVIKSKRVENLKKKNKKLFKTVFDFFIERQYSLDEIPSSFYKKQLKKVNSEEERLILIRDMLGALTDKGLIKLYNKIRKKID